ncbi:GGDEF domain-containing protein [Mycobacteroides franklinii]|uniref:Diguanylate cyclase DosC n=1 Tax=Mycobacteroides franklinii TaxID=948102 RepID=A0A4R8R3D0_9MYCO|nr:Diguanylate cyclase DosC [Mycobacteroides franklinii]TDZ48689.1 Diguanylate cyclase DosC [Mycobacteroides franklinii]TDZ58870.1 Diguanylate cyclase DosC [Mycobacteroides franklinii]TDZ66384.1 Diguanylate cyclase DosC [Mycobacteroides franklinii]TDZ72307.1 Diguanylate cyclase DosC [Mycobacteroides franklinii]
MGRLKIAIGLLCMSMVVLGMVVQFHPLGPRGLWPRSIQAATWISAFFVGVCWMVCPWPGRRWAIAFVFWADAATAIAAAMCSSPASRLGATNHMALIGIFAAFVLGWRVLVGHCVFASIAITAITLWNVHADAATLFGQYIYNAPAFSNVVLLPIIIQTVIEGGRRALWGTAFEAHRDPLTGLLNRRGVQSAIDYTLGSGRQPTAVMAVAVLDIDRFKQLNDNYGHGAGDSTLKAVADALLANIRRNDLAARVGGDEFMVVAFLHGARDVEQAVQRVRCLRPKVGDLKVSLSVGVAWAFMGEPDFNFDSLARQADLRLYENKRQRSGSAETLRLASSEE